MILLMGVGCRALVASTISWLCGPYFGECLFLFLCVLCVSSLCTVLLFESFPIVLLINHSISSTLPTRYIPLLVVVARRKRERQETKECQSCVDSIMKGT